MAIDWRRELTLLPLFRSKAKLASLWSWTKYYIYRLFPCLKPFNYLTPQDQDILAAIEAWPGPSPTTPEELRAWKIPKFFIDSESESD